MKDYKAALESDQNALQIRLKLFGEDHPDTAQSYYSIGVTQHAMKDYKAALDSHQHALQIRLKLFGQKHVEDDLKKRIDDAPKRTIEDLLSAVNSTSFFLARNFGAESYIPEYARKKNKFCTALR